MIFIDSITDLQFFSFIGLKCCMFCFVSGVKGCDLVASVLCWPLIKSVSRKRSFAVISWCVEKVLPMSLVDDILDVLRMVLEYFGVPPDMVSTHTHTHFC